MNPTRSRLATVASPFSAPYVVTYVAHTPGFHGPLALYGSVNIPRTAITSLDRDEVREHIFWKSDFAGLSRGLTNISFALKQLAGGFDPFHVRYEKTLLHLINGALVFWLCLLLLSRGTENDHRASLLVLAVTAVWLLYPLQVSAVLNAVQRLMLLSSLFVLAALIAYVKRRMPSFRRPVAGFLPAAGGGATFGALGILRKENAALLLIYLTAIEPFFFRLESNSHARKRLLYLLLGLVVALPIVAASAYGTSYLSGLLANYQNPEFTLTERMLTEIHAIALYLKLIFVPVPGPVSFFHDNFPIQRQLDIPTISLAGAYIGPLMLALWQCGRFAKRMTILPERQRGSIAHGLT